MKLKEACCIFKEIKNRYDSGEEMTIEDLKTLKSFTRNIFDDVKTEEDYDSKYCAQLGYDLHEFLSILSLQGYFDKYAKNEVEFIVDNSFILPLVLANDTYGKIKMTGDNRYMFLCQMHEEKTPSMAVFDFRNYFCCYGCEYNGGPIKYIEKYERLTLRDAIDLLTQIFLIDIKKPNKELAPLAEKYQKAILSSRYKELLEMGKERILKRRELPFNVGYSIQHMVPKDVAMKANLEEAYQKRYGTIERIEKGIYLPYGKE